MPAELDEITRRVTRLEIEEAALSKEDDPASRTRLEELRRELADLRGKADAKHAQWEAERQAIRRVQELRRNWSRSATRRRRPNAPTTSTAPPNSATADSGTWSADSPAEEEQLAAEQGQNRLLREVVTEEEIAEIVAA